MFTFFRNEEQIKEYYRKKASIQITKDNCKAEFKESVLENQLRLLPIIDKIKNMKRQLKEPAIRRRISNILLMVSILMTIITTGTTIAGGINYYNVLFTKITYINFIVFAQLSILIISCLKPYLIKKLNRYVSVVLFLQLCLLFVSISFNFIFLHNPDSNIFIIFLSLILCIVFDVVCLVMCEISIALRLDLEINKVITNNIFNRIFNIFNKLIDYKITSIENKIKNKMFSENENSINDIEVKKYLDYAKQNLKENKQLLSYKEIGKNLFISEHKAKKIHNNLIEKGIIKTENNKTFFGGC